MLFLCNFKGKKIIYLQNFFFIYVTKTIKLFIQQQAMENLKRNLLIGSNKSNPLFKYDRVNMFKKTS